jgi:hypothetical protein
MSACKNNGSKRLQPGENTHSSLTRETFKVPLLLLLVDIILYRLIQFV